jgi:hypothetical protein
MGNFDPYGQYEVAAFDATDTYLGGSIASAVSAEAKEAACKAAIALIAAGLSTAAAHLAGATLGLGLATALGYFALFGASAAVINAPGVGIALAGIVFGAAFVTAAILFADWLCGPDVAADGTRSLDLGGGGDSGGDGCQVVYRYETTAYDCGYQDSSYSDGEMTVTWHTRICWITAITEAAVICP